MPQCSRRTATWQCPRDAPPGYRMCERCRVSNAKRAKRQWDAKTTRDRTIDAWLRDLMAANIELRSAVRRLTADLSYERAKSAPPS